MPEIDRAERDRIEEGERSYDKVKVCAASRETRRLTCELLRALYEFGTRDGVPAVYNKLTSHLDRVASFIFSPGTARFGSYIPPIARRAWVEPVEIVRDEFQARWRDSRADLTFSGLLEWALVYGATVAKVQQHPYSAFMVTQMMPWDFGVSREDVPTLEDQDVLSHWYTMSVSQIERWARTSNLTPRRQDEIVEKSKSAVTTVSPGTLSGSITVSGVTGTFPNSSVTGHVNGSASIRPQVMVDEPVVNFVDLWERRIWRVRATPQAKPEEFEDWLVTTMLADTQTMVVQRRNPDFPRKRTGPDMVIPAEHPFVVVAPRPQPDYLFGKSELLAIAGIQTWLEDHVEKMRKAMGRVLNPSRFFSGFSEYEEAGRALITEGGSYGTADPSAKMEESKPTLDSTVFETLKIIEQFFNEASGTPEMIQDPSQASNVRATGQFTAQAGVAGARIRKQALFVEESINDIANKAFALMLRHDDAPYPKKDGKHFALWQIPHGTRLLVDAHSAAPIYAEQTQAKAVILQRAGVLKPKRFVELVNPPHVEELKLEAEEIEQNRAESQREVMRIQEMKALKVGAKGKK